MSSCQQSDLHLLWSIELDNFKEVLDIKSIPILARVRGKSHELVYLSCGINYDCYSVGNGSKPARDLDGGVQKVANEDTLME